MVLAMEPQFIRTPKGETLVVLPLADYEALRTQAEEAEDWEDLAIYHECMRKLESGEDEFLPVELTNHFMAGNSLLKSIRLWRGMSEAEVAKNAGIAVEFLVELESKATRGTEDILKRIAAVLNVKSSWLV